MDFTYSFGYWVLRRRKALNLTRVELARRVGCAPETIKKIERDERRPSLQIAALLADVLAVPSAEREFFLQTARGQRTVDRLGLASQPLKAPTAFPHHLPVQSTPFIGREAELVAIASLLNAPECRLLNLTGPGGIGKSRLAFKVAEGHRDIFTHGVYVDALAGVPSADILPASILAALGLELYGRADPKEQLFAYLQGRQVLLVLDNFEHLLEGTELLVNILQKAPRVTLLVTTRERLNLQCEWIFPVEGLPYPETDQAGDIETYGAVELFTQAARQLRSTFELNETNLQSVARICRLVEGMPLAVELAAAWIPVLEPQEIAREIEHSLDILEADLHDLPLRQRSLRAVFYASWELLSPPEQEAVQRLSVFRGGFSRRAAETTVGIDIQRLLVLVNKCWMQMEGGGRFRIHELIRQYAFEQLRQDSVGWYNAGEKHSAYYCRLLNDHEKNWHHKGELEAYSEIKAEIQNIYTAWNWALDQGRQDLLSLALESLCNFYDWSGRIKDGEAACQGIAQLLDRMIAQKGLQDADALLLKARVLTWQGRFTLDYQASDRLYEEAGIIFDHLEQNGHKFRPEKAQLFRFRGEFLSWSSPEQAKQLHCQSLALYQELDDEMMQAKEMINLSFLAWMGGDLDTALSLIRQSLDSSRKMGVRSFIDSGLDMLAKIYREKGQLEEAEQCHLQALELGRELGFRISEGTCLENLAHTLICAGRFAEAEVQAKASVHLHEMIGSMNEYPIYLWSQANSHLGLWTQARDLARRSLDEAFRLNGDLTICLALKQLGEIDLVEGRPSEALDWLQASLESARAHNQFILSATPLADLAYTHRALGQLEQARRCLGECLADASRIGSFRLAIHALPALALLEADRGNTEQGIELYTLACQYPYVANSKWFEDIAGREIACLEASLPTETATAARVRGRNLEFWGAIDEGVRTLESWKV